MKEIVLKWRDRDITVKYRCIKCGGLIYARVWDKNGEETLLYKRPDNGRWLWRGGINTNWPEDLIELLSDFFNRQIPDEIEPRKSGVPLP